MNSAEYVAQYRSNNFHPIFTSMLDTDWYKFSMGQLVWKHYRDVNVTFKLINRSQIPLANLIDISDLHRQLDHARTVGFTQTELAYLRGQHIHGRRMFDDEYIESRRNFRLPKYSLKRVGDQFELTFSGPWHEVMMWEVPALYIISELRTRAGLRLVNGQEARAMYAQAHADLYRSLRFIKEHPQVRWSDFATRRRNSFFWQENAVQMALDVFGDKPDSQFLSTSNVLLALRQGIEPKGTMAHELFMVAVALAADGSDEDMIKAQYRPLELWDQEYRGAMRSFLPDTYGTAQFLRNAPAWLLDWTASRQDSGDPKLYAARKIKWLQEGGVRPTERSITFSDGLDATKMVDLSTKYQGQIGTTCGWGTLFANNFSNAVFSPALLPYFKPVPLVCKVDSVNGRSAVKLSDNPSKATGPVDDVQKYLRVFGSEGMVQQAVVL